MTDGKVYRGQTINHEWKFPLVNEGARDWACFTDGFYRIVWVGEPQPAHANPLRRMRARVKRGAK